MTEGCLIEIVEHETNVSCAAIVAEEAAAWLGICAHDGNASVALPGGRSPAALLAELADQPIRWDRIAVTTTDERQVPVEHALSNMGAVLRAFDRRCGAAATFVRLDQNDACARIKTPFDLVVIGMGADGHVASLFPGLRWDGETPIVEVMPNEAKMEVPVPRWSWTMSALTSARRLLLVCAGDRKRATLERGLWSGEDSPVGALLRRANGPVTIHWAKN